jgi:hypothetical protein
MPFEHVPTRRSVVGPAIREEATRCCHSGALSRPAWGIRRQQGLLRVQRPPGPLPALQQLLRRGKLRLSHAGAPSGAGQGRHDETSGQDRAAGWGGATLGGWTRRARSVAGRWREPGMPYGTWWWHRI